MARMTTEDWIALVEDSDTANMITTNSLIRIVDTIKGKRTSAVVNDFEGGAQGTFTLAALSREWTALAREHGMSGIEFYESGEPDAADYAVAVERATFGEVIYG